MINVVEMFWTTLSGVIVKLPEFILIIWAVKTISKQMPKWISQYEQIKDRQRKIDWARGMK